MQKGKKKNYVYINTLINDQPIPAQTTKEKYDLGYRSCQLAVSLWATNKPEVLQGTDPLYN